MSIQQYAIMMRNRFLFYVPRSIEVGLPSHYPQTNSIRFTTKSRKSNSKNSIFLYNILADVRNTCSIIVNLYLGCIFVLSSIVAAAPNLTSVKNN